VGNNSGLRYVRPLALPQATVVVQTDFVEVQSDQTIPDGLSANRKRAWRRSMLISPKSTSGPAWVSL